MPMAAPFTSPADRITSLLSKFSSVLQVMPFFWFPVTWGFQEKTSLEPLLAAAIPPPVFTALFPVMLPPHTVSVRPPAT